MFPSNRYALFCEKKTVLFGYESIVFLSGKGRIVYCWSNVFRAASAPLWMIRRAW